MTVELEQWADEDGTELGDVWGSIARLWNSRVYVDESMHPALESLLRNEHAMAKSKIEEEK